MDCNFPLIEYESNKTPKEWGESHGESFRSAIKELFDIRLGLMLEKNPSLKSKIPELAMEQFEATKKMDTLLADEIEGIAKGASLALSDLVVLNNYTDFRDISLPEEGCSTIDSKGDDFSLAGQTWDMHGSAKDYISVIKTPQTDGHPSMILFSLVGCLGMAGFNSNNLFIGVNNINTTDAQAGVIWPALIRKVLEQKSFYDMVSCLRSQNVTSGHNYIVSSKNEGHHWEITPTIQEKVGEVGPEKLGFSFHTNHILGQKTSTIENKNSISSTTHHRYALLEKTCGSIQSHQDLKALLQSHDGHPKSICSHYEANTQDPSFTCGGVTGDFINQEYFFWRGCPVYDKNYKSYQFALDDNHFTEVKES